MSKNQSSKSLSRRAFIKQVGLGVAATSFLPTPMVLSALAANSEPLDVMVIGSGFGGAVTALRLAEQGIKTVMLERGQRWDVTDEQNTFSSLINPDGRSAWLRETSILGEPKPIEKYTGVLDLEVGNGIASLSGAGVGGGSLVYAGVLYKPNEQHFNLFLGQSVDYHEMRSLYYPKVKEIISPRKIPKKILRRKEYRAARKWKKLAKRAGLRVRRLDLGLDWDIVWDEIHGKKVSSVISGEFWYGNNSGAKLSVDKNYLKRAEESGFLEIVTHQDVTTIKEGPDGRFIVVSNELDSHGNILRERTYVVKKLFLAAGSVGTSKLLVGSKAKGNLPALNNQVGKNWGNNGDFFTQITNLNKKIKPNLGGTVPFAIEDFNNSIAPTSVECYADWSQKGESGIISSIGLSIPPAKGFFTYDSSSDQVLLNWPSNDPEITQILNAGSSTYDKLIAASGKRLKRRKVRHGHCSPHHRILSHNPVSSSITAHPLGGVVLDKATDNIGTIKNYSGLYIMDGSLIPGHTGCTNPALTIAALAERNIEQIIYRDFS